jgi:hypothetical protein
MARTILVIGAVAWLVVALVGLGAAMLGSDALIAALPPLAIDAEALGGALTVIAVAAMLIGAAHVGIVAGLRRDLRRARSAGVLLASVLAVGFLGLAATAAASALREPPLAPMLAGGCLAAAVAAIGYALTVARLIGDLRSGSAV